jgi:hypothetical protein
VSDGDEADEAQAFTVQARMFGGLAAFLVAVSIGYGVWTREYAGTVLLLLTGALAGLCGAYLGWRPRQRGAGGHADEPWFPSGSIWPFAIGAGAALVANGLLLGLWLALPAGVALAAAIGGFAAQSRRRD